MAPVIGVPQGLYDAVALHTSGPVAAEAFCVVEIPSLPRGCGHIYFQMEPFKADTPVPAPWRLFQHRVEWHPEAPTLRRKGLVRGRQTHWVERPDGVYTVYMWQLWPGEADPFLGYYNADAEPRCKAFTVHRECVADEDGTQYGRPHVDWVEFDATGLEALNFIAPTPCGRVFGRLDDPTSPWVPPAPGPTGHGAARSAQEALDQVLRVDRGFVSTLLGRV